MILFILSANLQSFATESEPDFFLHQQKKCSETSFTTLFFDQYCIRLQQIISTTLSILSYSSVRYFTLL